MKQWKTPLFVALAMPLRWLGEPDPTDPRYQDLERRVNLALHGALYAALNSGLWFTQLLRHPWPRLGWFSLAWLLALLVHLAIVVQRRLR
ncbi:hypothetical protein [Candidatus Synechococcus spongiarum]|nr:hypothetical protein [Candidatus Synechococcus spongiarum]